MSSMHSRTKMTIRLPSCSDLPYSNRLLAPVSDASEGRIPPVSKERQGAQSVAILSSVENALFLYLLGQSMAQAVTVALPFPQRNSYVLRRVGPEESRLGSCKISVWEAAVFETICGYSCSGYSTLNLKP